jgi:hypothetical protein
MLTSYASGLHFATDYGIVGCTSKLTKEEHMLQKYRNRARQDVKRRIEINLDGFELGLSPEEVIADLNFGVGPISETTRSAPEDRPQVGRVA